MTLPEIVKELRARRRADRVSQDALAVQLGVGRSTIYMWENGDREPGAANLCAWANALQCPLSVSPAHDEDGVVR